MVKRLLYLMILVTIGCVAAPGARADLPVDSLARMIGGRFVWVPDSMSSKVHAVLKGEPGLDEKVLHNGDPIQMVLKSKNFGRFDRGLSNYLFIPKGSWAAGLTVSYSEFSTKDLEVLDLLDDIDLGGYMFSINPYLAYFLRHNMSLGLKLGYSASKGSIDSFKIDIDEDMNFDLHDIVYKSKSYSAAIALRQYYGIGRQGRFGVFNEVDLLIGSGSSDFTRPYDGQPKTTHTDMSKLELNFMPGVNVFIMKNVSFNLSFGVFGFHMKSEKQSVDGEPLGERFTSGANFRFNIFNLNFGIEAHF